MRLFVDDCLLHITITTAADMDKLQSHLQKLEAWQGKCQMEFNPSKCFIMRISKQKNLPTREYIFRNTVLNNVDK